MTELIEHPVGCPYCGETTDVLINSEEVGQQYIEDCQVCCRPITFNEVSDETGDIQVFVYSENDTC
ncbi:MAG: CPXCG motif-containing cysteine-rich protein [Candidatus Sedimenticola endophacoides]